MNQKAAPTVVADDVVVTMAYTLTVNGEVIDTSEESDPLIFLQGYRNIIPGLERELYGLNVGDSKKVIVKPEDGYGDEDPEAFMEVPRSDFPKEIPLEVGTELEIRDEDDETLLATIDRVTKDSIRLNFNHPLAGKTLEFDVKILDLRAATEEELEHGHAHGGEEEDFDEFEFEDEEEEN
ncbi:FKBP-type peptidyl-prolyl cis-trans isomerase [Bellilinea sp.]|jgi:FKBP-type peptidyl-prolyl cis-trans isomerase SlyD|uniref:Peptidyl-prolyl cis-trans isomerase n=1 Tax=Bellilinea caldifistulae TaxID=360411 RepID=A0A7C4L187_9CHLR|nr:peptidylprolyl isomerase [Bellilinea sp.]